MKLTLKQLNEGFPALVNIGEDKTLSTRLKYDIARNMRLIQPDINAYEKSRVELIRTKYGVQEGEEGEYKVPTKNIEGLVKELEELQSVEVDLDIHILSQEAFANASANQMFLLDWMIDPTPASIAEIDKRNVAPPEPPK
jgi:hypothetical protein